MSGTISSPPCGKKLGTAVSRVKDTIYQAATDGFISGVNAEGTGKIRLFVEDVTPPTVIVQAHGGDQYGSVFYAVKKDDYYKLWTETTLLELGLWTPFE